MSRIVKHLALFSSFIALAACNENPDGHIAPHSPQTTLKGLVLGANAIQGAIVCLDSNDNLLCEAQEPQAKTNQSGVYQFNANALTAKQSSTVAYIPQGAMDVVTKEIIDKPYSLTTPLGKHAVISPLTSFVMETMRLHQGMDIDTASQIVSYQLKVKDFDVFKDYRSDSSESGKLILDVLNESIKWGKNLDNPPDTIKNYKHLFHTVTLNRLSFIEMRVPVKYSFETLESEIKGISSFMTHFNGIATQNYLYYTKSHTNISPSNVISAFPLYSIYPFTPYIKDYSSNFQYVTLKSTTKGEIEQVLTEYSIANKANTEINTFNNFTYRFLLTNTGWQTSNRISINNDTNQSIFIFKYNLSHLKVNDVLNALQLISSIKTPISATFPAESYSYKIYFVSKKEKYEHTQSNDNSFLSLQDLKNTAQINNQVPFNNFLSTMGITVQYKESSDSTTNRYDVDYHLQFLNSGQLNIIKQTIKNSNSLEIKLFSNSGYWQEQLINNQKVLKININSKPEFGINYLAQPFYTEHDGKVFYGKTLETGHIQTHYAFNKIAMDAITSNLQP
ncbi:hypothetical protein [Agitococcus lubricus]|uniref:Uncharacterized protein n=1 Tax=Agitococcus lubricus TaxID=1077255 RepID=A0A2T5J330_9GAMM|nr:hypothetical protein [Agitococcus lubricus]PTQ90812.1 hypothetical protein C8N29_102212 [Agitococcus lubricus]